MASNANNVHQLTAGLPVVVVLGATATGKTGLAIALARAFGGAVINADSRYFYRGMDIGTAKPTPIERQGVPHHLIDIADPTDDFSLATFLELAFAAIEDVGGCGRLPIVAGGTPQYLRGLLEGWQSPAVPPDALFRTAMERSPAGELHARLCVVDDESAARIDPRNKRRLIRALEIVRGTGLPVSASRGKAPPPYRFHVTGLRQPRERLRNRIDQRVRDMFAAGWLDEVARLRARGVTAATPSMSAHGYREALAVLEDHMTLEEAITQTQRMVHRYIRHQETWFRGFTGIHWFDSSEPGWEQAAVKSVRTFLDTPNAKQFIGP